MAPCGHDEYSVLNCGDKEEVVFIMTAVNLFIIPHLFFSSFSVNCYSHSDSQNHLNTTKDGQFG
jgi:hypothetical protein